MHLTRMLITLSLLLFASSAVADEVNDIYKIRPYSRNYTEPIIVHQPNGPFAAIIFPEDALGDYLGVILYDIGSQPGENTTWDLGDRFWQDKTWADDITSIAWGPSGKYLYVATSEIYGDGGIFQLNLLEKTFIKIYPTEDNRKEFGIHGKLGYETEIMEIKNLMMRIRIEFYDGDSEEPLIIESELPIE